MCLPALDAIRKASADARIGFMVPPEFGALYRDHPSIDDVLAVALPRGKNLKGLERAMAIRRAIREFRPRLVFLFVGTPRYVEIACRLAGARTVYRIPNWAGLRPLLTNSKRCKENDWDPTKHAVDDRLRAVRLHGIPASITPMRLSVKDEWTLEADAWLERRGWHGHRLVVMQVCASSVRRRWPLERFSETARRLLEWDGEIRFVISGSPGEKEYCETAASLTNDSRVATTAGELSITGLAAMLRRSSLLLTPDTGTMHLGHAVGVPSVCIYSYSDVSRTKALDTEYPHVVIRRRYPKGVAVSPADLDRCMSLISVDEVVNACRGILERENLGRAHSPTLSTTAALPPQTPLCLGSTLPASRS